MSLDVFDTVLTRSCGPPSAVFHYLGRRLFREQAIPCTPEVFARARERADRDVWDRAGGLDACVRLEDFYLEVCRSLSMDPAMIPALVAAELEVEEQVLRPMPQARRLIEHHRAQGRQVVFTTDTYFSRSFIEEQLSRHGLWPPGARVFASSEGGTSKAGGELFSEVLAAARIAPSALLHLGDNAYSDVAVPRQRGIAAEALPDGRLNRYETLLADHRWETAGLGAALAGASRLGRAHTPVRSSREAAIRDVACGVAAPFLVGYSLWLLQRARELGLERLYFVSRDGQIMAGVAGTLAKRLGLSIDIRYLFASRDSTNLAATLALDAEELGWIVRDLDELSSRDVLSRFDLPPEDVLETLPGLLASLDAPAGSSRVRELLQALSRDGPGRDLVLERAARRREIVTAYLAQEGVFEGGRVGFVDFGGVGSQMRALHTLVSGAGSRPPHLFLVGLDDPADAGLPLPSADPAWLHDTECYLYDHRRKLGVKRRRGFGTCVQMFCAADHGTVTGYSRDEDRLAPTLLRQVDEELITWGLPVFRRSVHAVIEHVDLDESLADPHADLRGISTALIDRFWSNPSVDEARAWGAFPFEGAQVTSELRTPLAQPYSWRYVLRGLLDRTFPNLGWMHWFEGSLKLSPPWIRGPLASAASVYRRFEQARDPRAHKVVHVLRRSLGRSDGEPS